MPLHYGIFRLGYILCFAINNIITYFGAGMDKKTIRRKMTIEVEFHHTDMMGVVHNAQYFNWFEKARLAIFEEIFSFQEFTSRGYALPVRTNFCEYKRPIKYTDPLILITTHRINLLEKSGLYFNHSIVHRKTKEEMATGEVVVTLCKFTGDGRIKLVSFDELPLDIYENYRSLK